MTARRTVLVASFTVGLAACATPPETRPAVAAAAVVAAAGPTVDATRIRGAAQGLGVRPGFRSCVDAAAGGIDATLACVDAELGHQMSRLEAALAARRGQGAGSADAAQSQWLAERDHLCGPDGPGVVAAQRLQAGLCRLEATAARADVLAR